MEWFCGPTKMAPMADLADAMDAASRRAHMPFVSTDCLTSDPGIVRMLPPETPCACLPTARIMLACDEPQRRVIARAIAVETDRTETLIPH